jgi:tetrahydromethanopterin S-methyltransferase subunit G
MNKEYKKIIDIKDREIKDLLSRIDDLENELEDAESEIYHRYYQQVNSDYLRSRGV